MMTHTTGRPTKSSLRRLAIVAVFALGTWAIAATSAAYTPIDVPASAGTLHLDPDQPVALQRVRIALTPEATGVSGSLTFQLGVDRPRGSGSGPGSSPIAQANPLDMRFIAMASAPDTVSFDPTVTGQGPAPWQAEVMPGSSVNLPLSCGGGPCERAFWLIAQLDDAADTGPVDVDWRVAGTLGYPGDWPSGAGATITFDPPVAIEGPAPRIAVSTQSETIRIGPGAPAAARVVEATIGKEAVGTGAGPIGTFSIDLRRDGVGGDMSPLVTVRVFPLDDSSAATTGPQPPTLAQGGDPFAGCPADEACTRRLLVTFAWAGSEPRDLDMDWFATVRRTDLLDVWTTPAQLDARVTRHIDIADAPPAATHLEGNVTPVDSDRGPQVRYRLTGRATSEDALAALLPVPATITYHAGIDGPVPSGGQAARGSASVTLRVPDLGTDPRYASFEDGAVNVLTGMAMRSGACRLGQPCDLELQVSPAYGQDGKLADPGRAYRWTLDIAAYTYEDVPVDLSVQELP